MSGCVLGYYDETGAGSARETSHQVIGEIDGDVYQNERGKGLRETLGNTAGSAGGSPGTFP